MIAVDEGADCRPPGTLQAPKGGITGSYNAGTGILSLSGTDTLANYQLALRTVQFSSSSEDPTVTSPTRTIIWAVTDANSDGAGAATGTVSTTLTVTPLADAPVVEAAVTASYTENAAATTLSGVLTLSDVDDTNMVGATVRIASGLTAGDTLSAVTTGTSITASYDAGSGVLTLSGNDTIARYQGVLRSIAFSSTSDNPTANSATRTIQWAVTDANSDGAGAVTGTASTTLTVTPVNDLPVAADDAVSVQQDIAVTITAAGLLANDSDVDGGTLVITGVTQPAHGTLVNNGNGTFTYTPGVHFHGIDSFVYTVSDGQGGSTTATVTLNVLGEGRGARPRRRSRSTWRR